jgi:hypothetical protein
LLRTLGFLAALAVVTAPLAAEACGCFVNPTTSTPALQAGERILFAPQGNNITAIVQIRYQGEASEFGWLLPLPSVPQLKVSTDELFEVLDSSTTPSFQYTQSVTPCSQPTGFGCGATRALSAGGGADTTQTPAAGPLVLRDTAGPYEYAVLKADSKAALTTWLSDNRFVAPVTSDAALAPYIRPGAFFLALKLRAGVSTQELRPVLLRYTSDYPMIPLILTSATAVPDMGVQVFLLGDARAIPRNYHHALINPFKLDWTDANNYGALVAGAVREAPEKHAFITEYAGTPSVAVGQLAANNRFGSRTELAVLGTPEDFVEYLYAHGYPMRNTQDLSETALALLEVQIPYPAPIANLGVTRQLFFKNLRTYLDPSWVQSHDWVYAKYPGIAFNPQTLSDDLWLNVAAPILDAEDLLKAHAKLTRMFTVLSPEDMTADPVFAFNSALPDVPLEHTASTSTDCNETVFRTEGLTAAQSELSDEKKAKMPNALRIEKLSEEGPPEVVAQYTLPSSAGAPACAVTGPVLMASLGALWLRARRRRNTTAALPR